MKASKRILSFILILTMLLSTVVFAATDTKVVETWDIELIKNSRTGREMPFQPVDKYVSEQNPPDFKWHQVEGAESYDLVIASDPEFKNVKYSKVGLTTNFYNFNHAFEEGVIYYWGVKYTAGGKQSEWSSPRRFRIQPGSTVYTVDDIGTMLSKIPETHPRIHVTPESFAEFMGYKDKYNGSKEVYEYYYSTAKKYVAEDVIETAPEEKQKSDFKSDAEYSAWLQSIWDAARSVYGKALVCGFAYMLSGDEELAKFGIKCLVELSKYDINGATSYGNQDQVHREIMYKSAIAYDWLYNAMTDSDKEQILKMIRDRALVMATLLNTIPESPFQSHGWNAFAFIAVSAYATYGEMPDAEEWLKITVPCYSAVMPPWSTQDGGWAQGTDYWRYSTQNTKEFIDVFSMAGLVNIYDKAWSQNEYLWILYAYPPGSYGSFGDDANWKISDLGNTGNSALQSAYFNQNPVAKWIYDQYGATQSGNYKLYYTRTAEDAVEAEAPVNYPLAHEFSDIGWIVMSDDLINKDRIQTTFKSSPYGSYNHSHADQNSFIIQAYGERLAIKSGYYDSYHSTHDLGFAKKTPAHNTVTVATSKGQNEGSIFAKGKLTGFLNQVDFDLAGGDASDAYADSTLERFERSMIYIRPDIFVVIDDLKMPENRLGRFEWWLNAEHDISLYDNANGARLQEGNAVLDATVQYPENVKSFYNNTFASSNMIEVPAGGKYKQANVQRRVWFETEKVNNTKMVVTMDIHRSDKEARYTDAEYFEDYMKLSFEDGTVVLVNLTEDNREIVTADGFTFTGQAVVYNERSIMLAHGTELKHGDKELIILEKEGSVVMGADEMGISTYEDNRISVNTDNWFVDGIEKVTDYDGNEISEAYGITYEKGKLDKAVDTQEYTLSEAEDYVTFTAQKDNYTLMLNGKFFESQEKSGTVKLIIDGVDKEYTVTGYEKRDGSVKYTTTVEVPQGKYIFKNKTRDIYIDGFEVGDNKNLNKLAISTSHAENNVIELECPKIIPVTHTFYDDYDALKGKLTLFKEAEDITGDFPSPARAYTSRSFLSGGAGVSNLNTQGQMIKYTFEVKETGVYDFAVKYVAFNSAKTRRAIEINGKNYSFELPQTIDYGTVPENWKAIVAETGVELEAGTYTLTIEPVEGQWNYDWIGLVKR